EPLDGSGCHEKTPPLPRHERVRKAWAARTRSDSTASLAGCLGRAGGVIGLQFARENREGEAARVFHELGFDEAVALALPSVLTADHGRPRGRVQDPPQAANVASSRWSIDVSSRLPLRM